MITRYDQDLPPTNGYEMLLFGDFDKDHNVIDGESDTASGGAVSEREYRLQSSLSAVEIANASAENEIRGCWKGAFEGWLK